MVSKPSFSLYCLRRWVERRKLAALEHVMSTMARPSLYTLMVGGDGGRSPDVFHETDKFLHKRKRSEEEVQVGLGSPCTGNESTRSRCRY